MPLEAALLGAAMVTFFLERMMPEPSSPDAAVRAVHEGGSPFETRAWRGSPVASGNRDDAAIEAGPHRAALPRSGQHAPPRCRVGGADETCVRASPASWAL